MSFNYPATRLYFCRPTPKVAFFRSAGGWFLRNKINSANHAIDGGPKYAQRCFSFRQKVCDLRHSSAVTG